MIILISYVVILISLLIIAFNVWSIIRKYKNKSCKISKLFIEKGIAFNILAILLGLYFILMVQGRFLLLKFVIFVIGLMIVIGGILELFVDSIKLKKGGSLLFFIIKTAFSLFMLTFGVFLVFITIDSLRQ